jgi:hypothetical protein
MLLDTCAERKKLMVGARKICVGIATILTHLRRARLFAGHNPLHMSALFPPWE